MAVIPMWRVDRDDSMHISKSDADKHDQMLEIGEHFAAAVKAAGPDVTTAQAEAIGLFLSRNRDAVARLCKGSNEALFEAISALSNPAGAAVTPIRAAQ
ncbi:MAG TPA: YebG family protein [Spongiibacteraceae bacterium]|nr:YebG family protein [Spongiibacteraceae bacterium]